MNTLKQIARTYRNLCKQVQQSDAHIRKARAHVHDLTHKRNQTIQELAQLRTIMEYCVITGQEPTQAKLSHTQEQMQDVIKEHRRHMGMDDFYYTNSGSTVTISTTGLSSLLGAQGATGTSISMGAAGSNGPTGYPYVSVTSAGSHLIINDDVNLMQNSSVP